MKPVLQMEEGKPVEVSLQGVVEQREKPERSRLVKRLAIGLGAAVIVALVTGLAVFFGAKLSRDSFREARQVYRRDYGNVVEEVTKVTDTEVIIKVTNVIETVFDYKNGLMVERFVDSKTKVKSACYARNLNETTAPTTDPERYQGGEMTLNQITFEQTAQKWVPTARKLSKHLVSESITELCKDTDIFWMEKVEDDGIMKRATCYNTFYYYECYPQSNLCSYYCRFDNYCMTADGTWYMYETGNWYSQDGCIMWNGRKLEMSTVNRSNVRLSVSKFGNRLIVYIIRNSFNPIFNRDKMYKK